MPSPYDLPEWPALLAAIRANPADDLPRLVAADWLDEYGQPERAEFIRRMITPARVASGRRRCVRAPRQGTFAAICRLDPWADPRVMGEVRKAAYRVEAVMVGNPHAVAVWHRGFLTAIHCGGHALSAEVVARLAGEPLEEVRLFCGVRKRTTREADGRWSHHWLDAAATSADIDGEYTAAALEVERQLITAKLPTVGHVLIDLHARTLESRTPLRFRSLQA